MAMKEWTARRSLKIPHMSSKITGAAEEFHSFYRRNPSFSLELLKDRLKKSTWESIQRYPSQAYPYLSKQHLVNDFFRSAEVTQISLVLGEIKAMSLDLIFDHGSYIACW